MAKISRAFSTRGAVAAEAVATALQPRFAVAVGPERTVSRTWLDTFDWRLHAAGISLEYVDGGPLTAHLPDGARLQSPLPAGNWPGQGEGLPGGPHGDELRPACAR